MLTCLDERAVRGLKFCDALPSTRLADPDAAAAVLREPTRAPSTADDAPNASGVAPPPRTPAPRRV